jgi:hypothetical protein
MKKIWFLLVTAAITIATSCNNDSPDNNDLKEMNHNEKEMKEMKTDSLNIDSTTHKNQH